MPLRLIFMGTPDFAVPTLVELAARGYEIAAVYTRAPRPAGRGMDLQPSPVEREARRLGLPVLTPKTLKDAEAQAAFRAHNADVAVVVAYGLILPKAILEAPRLGCFNVHASLLPRWRGAAPINRAIMAGDAESGVTIMKMDEGLDTGAMAMAERTPIGADMTAGDLHDVLARLGADLMPRALAALSAARSRSRRSRSTASLMPRRFPRRKRASIGPSPGRRCITTSAGCRRFPAPGSKLMACASRRYARPKARVVERPARCSTTS